MRVGCDEPERFARADLCAVAGTVNQCIAAVRRLAYEAADFGLLSPELAAGIRRVKGVKQFGARTGNWLTQDQARLLLEKANGDDLRSARDLAMLSALVGCGTLCSYGCGSTDKARTLGHCGPSVVSQADRLLLSAG